MHAPPLDVPHRILMGPGPSEVPPQVLAALAVPTIGHLDPAYLELMDRLQEMLRGAFRTANRLTLAVSGTGSAGQEATVVNLVEPGDSVLVCVAGLFGERLAEMAERAGGVVSRVERRWGEVFRADDEDLREALDRARPKVVAIVAAETSTGAWQGIEEISALVHDAGALLLVDAVTALGGVPLEVDAWQIDAVYSGTQKCLSCPPGLAPVSFSERAVEAIQRRKTKVQSWYLDVSLLASYWDSDRVYHHTAPINMSYALYEALRILHAEGLEASWARHARHHRALRAGLEALGMEYVPPREHCLPQLSAVKIPAGVDDATVRRELVSRFGIEIGGGLGELKGRAWRIGLMGHTARAGNVLALLAALEQLLGESGLAVERGAALTAANRQYDGQTAQVGSP